MRRLCMIVVWFSLMQTTSLSLASTTQLSGANEDAFQAALQQWLNDNDRDSLNTMAEQARAGNEAAALFLARAEVTERIHSVSAYVKQLSRQQRFALFRSPLTSDGQSLFNLSWLQKLSNEGHSYANLLHSATALGVQLSSIKQLYRSGEKQAAQDLVRNAAVNGRAQQLKALSELVPEDDVMQPFVHAFVQQGASITTARTALNRIVAFEQQTDPSSVVLLNDESSHAALQFVDQGYQAGHQRLAYKSTNRQFGTVAHWVLNAPEARPLAKLCRQVCSGADQAACANLAFGLIGGYYEVIRFRSPLQSILSQADYLDSLRAQNSVLRSLKVSRTDAGVAAFTPEQLYDISPCLAEAMRS